MLPIRCFTCNKILGHLCDAIESYHKPLDVTFYKNHNIQRYCCRKILSNSVDIYKEDLKERDESFYKVKKHVEVVKILPTI